LMGRFFYSGAEFKYYKESHPQFATPCF